MYMLLVVSEGALGMGLPLLEVLLGKSKRREPAHFGRLIGCK
jgi:hypothetical protein